MSNCGVGATIREGRRGQRYLLTLSWSRLPAVGAMLQSGTHNPVWLFSSLTISSHGAGIKQKTLSDLVKKIEYVDANGALRIIDENDERFLSAASGCFGLLGIVTHLTMQLEPMSYARLQPAKVDVVRAVPPPPDMKIKDLPIVFQKQLSRLSPAQRVEDQADFERRALDSYYAEWFWFPYHDQVWINTWNKTDDPKGAQAYPGNWGKIIQFVETVAIQVLQNTPFYRWFGGGRFALSAATLMSRCIATRLSDD